MKSPINIHPPKNWQDFETLCLKLWGEIWNIPHEIEFNSDNSQGQHGVDIFGSINNGLNYNGIQCKNKKLNLIDGSPNRITFKDIQTEIDKAKSFIPNLNKLIIATSLPKDQKIEEYIRVQSVANLKNGLFSIQICFWEFFERNILEFENVYNWYLKNEDFHKSRQISVKFSNGNDEIVCHPKFQKTIKRYILKPKVENLGFEYLFDNYEPINNKISNSFKSSLIDDLKEKNFKPTLINLHQSYVWGQNCWLKLQITNSGKSVIEDFKIELNFIGDYIKVGAESKNYITNPHFANNVKEYNNTENALYVRPNMRTLVKGDSFNTGNFFITPKIKEGNEIRLKWKLISRDFSDSGVLVIKIIPKYYKVFQDIEVDKAEEVREEITCTLFKRNGILGIGGINYLDNTSDYTFE